MNNLNLKACGVSEMTKEEMINSEGGCIQFLLQLAVALVMEIIKEPTAHATAFRSGMQYVDSLM